MCEESEEEEEEREEREEEESELNGKFCRVSVWMSVCECVNLCVCECESFVVE